MDIPDLEAERARLVAAKKEIQAQIDAITARIQAACCHRWKLHQIAGNGRYCLRCGAEDHDFDD